MVEFKRLQTRASMLNACIRCGYCYEHCPLFKSTRWEVDAPRAKLTMLYGMLNGELEPSNYIAEKLFECFHCLRCENACSSGVPLTKVFADARADLLDAGFEVSGTTSITDDERCVRCLNCVRMCGHEARSFIGDRVVVDRLKCQSCGNCLDVCSAQAVSIRRGFGTNPDELRAQIRRFLSDPDNPAAKVIVFACTWSNSPGFQMAQMTQPEKAAEYLVLFTACSGRLRTELTLDALEHGAWGVLVTRCPEDDCDHGGSHRTQVRLDALGKWLTGIGVDRKRIQEEIVAKGDPKAFGTAVSTFVDQIRAQGPLGKAREA